MRTDYGKGALDEALVHRDPIVQFQQWMDEAVRAGIEEPNAMTLATATPDGLPSARMVLLKGCDSKGFTFFTSYGSRKGRELEANPHAALVFFWKEMERQVRVEGMTVRVSPEESDEYFASRPVDSQASSTVSMQSSRIPGRQYLEKLLQDFLAGSGPPFARPRHWGGYRLVPNRIEFWQGRPGRLHDRILYTASPEGWEIIRLAP